MKREKEKIINSIISNNQDKKLLLDLIINKNYSVIADIAKELSNKVQEKDIKNAIKFENINEIKYVRKIPVDKRHSTKVDYNKLKKIRDIT